MKQIKFLIAMLIFFSLIVINSQAQVRTIINTYDAVNIGAFAPSTMTAGSSHKVWVTMQNTGSATWDPFIRDFPDFSLRPFTSPEVDRPLPGWGINSVPLRDIVRPGEVHRFEFTVNAPWSAGVYDFRWRMARGDEFFGEASQSITVSVVSDISIIPSSDVYANFFTQMIPIEMKAGERYNGTITMINTGKTPWLPGYSWLAFHDAVADANINLVGIERIGLDREIPPGESATFNFSITAPDIPGAYNYQWRMANSNGTFGELSEGMRVYVLPNPDRPADIRVIDRSVIPEAEIFARFNSQMIPAQMRAGERYNATVRMTNTGRTNWVPDFNWLTFTDARAGINLNGIDRVGLDREIRPGETAVFNFTITAPETPGVYNYRWRMANANGTFGDMSETVRINIVPR